MEENPYFAKRTALTAIALEWIFLFLGALFFAWLGYELSAILSLQAPPDLRGRVEGIGLVLYELSFLCLGSACFLSQRTWQRYRMRAPR